MAPPRSRTATGPGWSSTRYAGASLGSNSSGPTAATTLGKLRLRWQRRRGCAWRSPSGATTERLRRLAAPLGGRAHLLLVRKKPAPRQGLREPCRNSGRLRCPRLDPADPEAACQGVTICLHCKMTEVCKGWVKGPSLTRAAMTRKCRNRSFRVRLKPTFFIRWHFPSGWSPMARTRTGRLMPRSASVTDPETPPPGVDANRTNWSP